MFAAPGSSPLARGTRSEGRSAGVVSGLIPARAGNTYRRFTASAFCRAHPRSRGEHPLPGNPSTPDAGSSPLARGTPRGLPGNLPSPGLIPARAGNTLYFDLPLKESGAHPRSRGEHVSDGESDTWHVGSSPLARGTRRVFTVSPPAMGLIPARAGNTRRSNRRP